MADPISPLLMRISLTGITRAVAFLLITGSAVSLWFALHAEASLTLMCASLTGIASTVVLVFLVSRGVLLPIMKMRKAIRRAAGGDLTVRVPPARLTELRSLTRELNDMLSRLATEKGEVKDVRNIFEVRVRARTRELEELTGNLEQKVQERTEAMEEKMKELERFRRLAVGRELRMVELKKELRQRKERLGEELEESLAAPKP